MRHIQGCSRYQSALLPMAADDYIGPAHPVRVLHAFVERLDLGALGFRHVETAATGRPPYHPGMLLRLFLWGYLNRVRSSRRLEKECGRNVELFWLLDSLAPDFKTIANFRRDNAEALVLAGREFAVFCRGAGLFGAELVAVDGSKFQAASSVRSVYGKARLERELAQVERQTVEYLEALAAADAADDAAPSVASESAEAARVKAALEKLSQRGEELQVMAADMQQSDATHRVRGEPDARVMRKAGGGSGGNGGGNGGGGRGNNSNGVNGAGRVVGYNVQAAVDSKHKLIASCDVTTAANDHGQLYPQAKAAKDAVGADQLTVVADAGYKNAAQSRACEDVGVSTVLPAQREVNPHGAGKLFSREAFEYDAERDQYTCPGGETLAFRRIDAEARRYTADATACGGCLLKAQCTRSRYRTVKRQLHAEALERANRRAAERPELLRRRAALVEHPFGNLKRMMDGGRFLMRGLKHVKAEMSLSVLAYNLQRATNIMGAEALCAQLLPANID